MRRALIVSASARAPPPGGRTYNFTTSKKMAVLLQPTSLDMRCTVPVPIPSDFATFKIPTPFASCFRTLRSVALSIFGRPSFAPRATAAARPRAPLRRDEETPIVAARLQDHDVRSIRHVLVDAAEHHPRRFEGHSGIGHLSIDALGAEQGLQLRGIC